MNGKLCVTPAEAAEMVGVSKPIIYQLCNRADFPTIRFGRAIRIPVDGLRAWLDQQAQAQQDA